jgi:hypothetical protein
MHWEGKGDKTQFLIYKVNGLLEDDVQENNYNMATL